MKNILLITSFLVSSVLFFANFDTLVFPSDSSPSVINEFINYETAHLHPIDLTPDKKTLLAVNIANYSLEVYDVTADGLSQRASIQVGVDPVTVRAKSNTEAWVVNQISDNISIVDLTTNLVVKTLKVPNEPWDVVFAGTPEKAFVSSAEPSKISVYNLNNLDAAPTEIPLHGEDVRALALSPDKSTVYGAFFESGNQSTMVAGEGGSAANRFAPDIDQMIRKGPYGNVKLVPNDGDGYNPPLGPAGLPADAKGIPVKKDVNGRWMDDNGGDWSNVISGGEGHRVVGWDLLDHDVAMINTNTLALNYQNHLGNMLMAMDVNPVTGHVYVVGTDGMNEIRFEPVINGKFLRVNVSGFAPGGTNNIVDLNPHLDYQTKSVAESLREQSLGDPRGIAWMSNGNKAYVTGMGSNNVITIDQNGNRLNPQPIEVGEGPTGIKLDETLNRAYVMNKFDGSISIINLATDQEINRIAFFDPTPLVVKRGRKHLYDTHLNSGTGHISCASCHVDAKYDRLGWDLSDPAGEKTPIASTVKHFDFGSNQPFHPVKGAMVTTSFIDIIKPNTLLHWRGDRETLHEFAAAWTHLQGRENKPTTAEIDEFEAFIAEIYYSPNPNRNLDNTFKTSMELPAPFGETPLIGDAKEGLREYLTTGGVQKCIKCHEPNTGRGDITRLTLRPLRLAGGFRGNYDQTGFWKKSATGSTSGWGFFSSGVLDSRIKFFEGDFGSHDHDALQYSFEGSDLNAPPQEVVHFSQDSHAAVGQQTTVNGAYESGQQAFLAQLKNIIDQSSRVSFIVNGLYQDEIRSFYNQGGDIYQSDRAGETATHQMLVDHALAGNALTWTVVFEQEKVRASVDKNNNDILDRDEVLALFTYDRTEPYDIPAIVTFDGSPSLNAYNNPLTYTWDFGDGNTGTGVAPEHTYAAPGTYTVSLTITDEVVSISSTQSQEVEIIPGCAAEVGQPCTDPCYIGGVILPDCGCSGTLSTDTDGDGLCDITDPCPNLDNSLWGTPCDDNSECTINDVWQTDCSCAGTFIDFDRDGVCDVEDKDDDNDGIIDAIELNCRKTTAERTDAVTTTGSQRLAGNLTTEVARARYNVDLSDASLAFIIGEQFEGEGVSYCWRDQNKNFSSIITISPDPGIAINRFEWGPDVMNLDHFRYDNNSQTITVSWNTPQTAILHDPANQLAESDGTILSSGDKITQLEDQNDGKGSWYIEWDLDLLSSDFKLTTAHNDPSSNLDFDGYSFFTYLCSTPDLDGDNILNHLDLDVDGDDCADAMEGDKGGSTITASNLSVTGQILGGVDANGVPVLAGGGQGIGSSQSSSAQGVCFVVQDDSDNDGVADGDDCAPMNPDLPAPEGTPCDDGIACTTGSVLDANCNCINGVDTCGIAARVLLEGFYDEQTDLMRAQLNVKNLLPLQQPFNRVPWNYAGTEAVTAVPENAVDWILLMTRDADGTVLDQAAGFLTSSGDIIGTQGQPTIPIDQAPNNYFSVHHQSHLAVVSSQPYDGQLYDFTTDAGKAQGIEQLKEIDGNYVMHAGDYDCTGVINSSDFNDWKIQGAILNQYLPIDGDGNGIVNSLDYNLWINNRSKVGQPVIRY